MKYFILALSLLVNGLLVYVLDTRTVLPLPLGSFLSVQEGVWQNAESVHKDFNGDLKLNGLKGEVNVYFDDRLVPHVFATEETDAYFVQGYLTLSKILSAYLYLFIVALLASSSGGIAFIPKNSAVRVA